MEQNNIRNKTQKWNNNGDQQLKSETTIMYHMNKRMNINSWNNKRTNGKNKWNIKMKQQEQMNEYHINNNSNNKPGQMSM